MVDPMKTFDCLCFGSSAFDILMSVERPPRSDERIPAEAVTLAGGGPASTAATAMARLGLRVGVVAAVGQDAFGQLMIDEFTRYAIDVSGIQRVPGSSTISSVLIERSSGKRSMTVYGGCTQRLETDSIDYDRIAQARIVHLDGNNPVLALKVARAAQAHTVPVSLDGGNMALADVEKILPFVDIYTPDEQSVRKQLGDEITMEEACRRYHAMGPGFVCITRAEHGSIAFDGLRFWSEPAYRGVAIIDTTGAGDNFHGAYIAAWLEGRATDAALRFAGTYAALCCRGIGGRASAPDRAETLLHLARFPGGSGAENGTSS